MAAPDHTALIRPCFATDGTLAALPDGSRVAGMAELTPSPHTQQDGIARVTDIPGHLSADSDARKRRQSPGWLAQPRRWPFIPVHPDDTEALIRRPHQRDGIGASPAR
jgi:hypothetical protein